MTESTSGSPARATTNPTIKGLRRAAIIVIVASLSLTAIIGIVILLGGGSDEAGFVQIIRGRVDDPSRLKAMMADADALHEMRPEILGATLAIEPDGSFVETVAFTSEAAAREGEQVEPPADVRAELEYAMQGATFHDLHHPWFHSA